MREKLLLLHSILSRLLKMSRYITIALFLLVVHKMMMYAKYVSNNHFICFSLSEFKGQCTNNSATSRVNTENLIR